MGVSGEDAPLIYPASCCCCTKTSHIASITTVLLYRIVWFTEVESAYMRTWEDLPSRFTTNFNTAQAVKFLLLFHIVWLTWIELACMHLERMHQGLPTSCTTNNSHTDISIKSMHEYMRGCTMMYLQSSFATNSHTAKSHTSSCCFVLFGHQE